MNFLKIEKKWRRRELMGTGIIIESRLLPVVNLTGAAGFSYFPPALVR